MTYFHILMFLFLLFTALIVIIFRAFGIPVQQKLNLPDACDALGLQQKRLMLRQVSLDPGSNPNQSRSGSYVPGARSGQEGTIV